VQPERFPVTVYVVVTDGVAVTFGPEDVFSVDAGLQEYEFAPVAVSTAFCPLQIVSPGEIDIAGTGLTFTVV
jgi:hypothetical protein